MKITDENGERTADLVPDPERPGKYLIQPRTGTWALSDGHTATHSTDENGLKLVVIRDRNGKIVQETTTTKAGKVSVFLPDGTIIWPQDDGTRVVQTPDGHTHEQSPTGEKDENGRPIWKTTKSVDDQGRPYLTGTGGHSHPPEYDVKTDDGKNIKVETSVGEDGKLQRTLTYEDGTTHSRFKGRTASGALCPRKVPAVPARPRTATLTAMASMTPRPRPLMTHRYRPKGFWAMAAPKSPSPSPAKNRRPKSTPR